MKHAILRETKNGSRSDQASKRTKNQNLSQSLPIEKNP